jgi:hypothetical protein
MSKTAKRSKSKTTLKRVKKVKIGNKQIRISPAAEKSWVRLKYESLLTKIKGCFK